MKIFKIILLLLLMLPFVSADDVTSKIENYTFDTTLNIYVTNNSIKIQTETDDVTYANAYPFNYSYSYSLSRDINASYNYYSTVDTDSNITCPEPKVKLNLTCPNITLDTEKITGSLRNYIDSDIRPDVARLNELDAKLSLCRDDLIEIQTNTSQKLSTLGKCLSDSNNYKNLFENEKDKHTLYQIMIAVLLCTLGFMLFVQINGGNLSWRKVPWKS